MIIDLPKRFSIRGNNDEECAEIKGGVLHIHGDISIRRLMYELTYALKSNKECFYCKAKLKKKQLTLDHMYAKDCGGPTIPNNLVPCCDNCNSEKSSMNANSYMAFRSMNEDDAKAYRKLVEASQELAKKNGNFDLPLEWVEIIPIERITVRMNDNIGKGKRYKKQEKHFKKYGNFAKPVVVDKNGFVLEGSDEVVFAIKNDITEIPAIILENVIMHTKC